MYTTICRRSSIPAARANSASIGTKSPNTGPLPRYAAIIANCAIRPYNPPRTSSGTILVWSINRWA